MIGLDRVLAVVQGGTDQRARLTRKLADCPARGSHVTSWHTKYLQIRSAA